MHLYTAFKHFYRVFSVIICSRTLEFIQTSMIPFHNSVVSFQSLCIQPRILPLPQDTSVMIQQIFSQVIRCLVRSVYIHMSEIRCHILRDHQTCCITILCCIEINKGNSVFFRIFLQSVMAAVIPVIHLIACHQCFDEDQPNPLFLTVLSEFIHIGKIQISGCLGIFLENRFPVLFSRTAVNRNKSPDCRFPRAVPG